MRLIDRLDEIYMELEKLRKEMHKTIDEEKDMLSCKVISVSQKLDELLVEYERLKSQLNS